LHANGLGIMRMIIADQHPQVLWALRTVLEEQPEFDLLGEAVDSEELLKLAAKHTIDLVLVDRNLPGRPIEDLIARLHALQPKPFVVVMSNEFEYSRTLLKSGADAFVSKEDQPDWLLDTLHRYAQRIASGR
jgi:DNA-binding NarL/FixJ family response regulator